MGENSYQWEIKKAPDFGLHLTRDFQKEITILIAPTTGFELPKSGTYRARIIEIVKHPTLNEDWGPQLLIMLILARNLKSVNQHDVSSSNSGSLSDVGPA